MIRQIEVPHFFHDHICNLLCVFASEYGLDLSLTSLFGANVKVGHILEEHLDAKYIRKR
jgi:hypothetical protein